MIKCNVCGSENEAAALFCGTCGSPLNPAEAKAIVEEATKPDTTATTPDDTVVPGQGAGARRDLGTGAPQDQTAPVTGVSTETMAIRDDIAAGKPTITCSVCGTINEATRTYCRKCANELKPAPPPPPPPPAAPTPRRISPIAIGLGAAAVVVAIALIGVLALGGGPGATTKPSARASLPPSAGASTVPSQGPTATTRTFTEGKITGIVAFARCPQGGSGTCTLYTIKADGSARSVQITGASAGSAFDPSISWDEKYVVFSVSTGLKIVTIKTKSWVQHSTGAGDSGAAFSPDNQQLVFSGVRSRDNNGTDTEIRIDSAFNSSVASAPITSNDVPDSQPVWSKDGKTIYFVEGDGASAELMSIDVASKTVTQLTHDQFEDVDPAISPDGTLLAFASNRGGNGFQLWLMDLTNKTIEPLPVMKSDARHPSWSPGGRYLVFSSGAKGSEDLFILDLKNNAVSDLTTGPSADISPTWH